MFSGIIEGLGEVKEIIHKPNTCSLVLYNKDLFESPSLGASISVNGVCLTQSKWEPSLSTFDLVHESLVRSNLGKLKKGDFVNLERSLQVGARIDGHFVQGHVDCIGTLHEKDTSLQEYWFEVPKDITPFLIEKGSIALDGISLTLAEVKENQIRLALVPHTLLVTNMKNKKVGDTVNIEVDQFAKHIHKYLNNTNLATPHCV